MAEFRQSVLFMACLLSPLIPRAITAMDKADMGRASYSTRMPEGVKLPPAVIHRTDNRM